MSWLAAIALALGAFVIAVFAFRVPRAGWTTVAAALALGLAGYALQASPEVPAAPATSHGGQGDAAWALVDERKSMIASEEHSRSGKLIVADAYARRGQFADAAAILRGAIADNPRDGEAWLALGNALVEHTGGALTDPALLAYRRAAELDPDGVGPRVLFLRVPERKHVKNRLHFDLRAGKTDEAREAKIIELTHAGAASIRRVDENGQWWMVMSDPEGNEFCVT